MRNTVDKTEIEFKSPECPTTKGAPKSWSKHIDARMAYLIVLPMATSKVDLQNCLQTF